MLNKSLLSVVAVLVVIFFGILYVGLYRDPTRVPSPLIGKGIPHFHLPQLHNPQKWATHDGLKGKVTVLNVWATWCVACAEEHPFLMEKAALAQVRWVGLDYKDDPKAARQWLKVHGDPYEWVLMDPSGRAALEWGVYGTPETFLIDKKGIIRYKHVGPLTAALWHREVEPLLEEMAQ